MFRRRMLACSGLALGLAMGCGPVYRTKWKIERALQRAEWAMMPNQLDYGVYQPSHRVVLSAYEVLKEELEEVKVTRVELTRDRHFDTPEGKSPVPGSVSIPSDHPACWLEGSSISKEPILVNCHLVVFEGKTKDGEKVDAQVRLELTGSDQKTIVSVQVGGRGDARNTKSMIDLISARVMSPLTRPDSPEERAALRDAFDLGPKADVDSSEETGAITIKRR